MQQTNGNAIMVLMRFFCSRRGAAVSRAMITLSAGILVALLGLSATVGRWAVNTAWDRFAAMESAVYEMRDEKKIASFAESARDRRLAGLEGDVVDLEKQVNDHERRIYRMEGR